MLGGSMADAGHRKIACPRIAYMPQGLGKNLYPTLSVAENIDFFARLFGHGSGERRRRIAELTRSTGLAPFVDRSAGKLSGGMKQKLGLCCALIHDPDLLILDEPTSGVDPVARDALWRVLVELSRHDGVTIFISTHFMNEAERCDRVSLMHAGEVLGDGRSRRAGGRARRRHAGRSLHRLSGGRLGGGGDIGGRLSGGACRTGGCRSRPAPASRPPALARSAAGLELLAPRDAGAHARPDPPDARAARQRHPHGRDGLRHQLRRGGVDLRRARPRPDDDKP